MVANLLAVLCVCVYIYESCNAAAQRLISSIPIGMKSCQLITVSLFVIVTGSPTAPTERFPLECLSMCDEQQINRQTR